MEALCVDANTDRNMRFAAQPTSCRRLRRYEHTHIMTVDQNQTHWQTMDVLGLVTWSPLLQEFPRRRWPHSKATASSALNSAHRAAVNMSSVTMTTDTIGSHNDPHHMYAPTTVPRCLSLRLLLMVDFASYSGSSHTQ